MHILAPQEARRDWLEHAIASTEGQPVNLHVIENGSSIGEGRAKGYSIGDAELVAYLDSDDWLYPGAIQRCIDALACNPQAVAAFTDRVLVDTNERRIGAGISTGSGPWDIRRVSHTGGYCESLAVMRRAAVLPYLNDIAVYPDAADHLLACLVACRGDWVHVDFDGYAYRQHANNSYRRISDGAMCRIMARANDALRAANRLPFGDVDVHVLYCHEPAVWVQQCLDSLCSEPVNVYLRPGIDGNVGLARQRAFAYGSSRYVSFVDSDDQVMSGAFQRAIDLLDLDPGIVSTYCDLALIDSSGREYSTYRKRPWTPLRQLHNIMGEVHHLHVMRRGAVMKCIDEMDRWPSYEEWVLMGLLARYGRHHHIPEPLYRFRQHRNYRRAGADMITPQLRRAGVKRCAPILLDLHRRGIRQAAHS